LEGWGGWFGDGIWGVSSWIWGVSSWLCRPEIAQFWSDRKALVGFGSDRGPAGLVVGRAAGSCARSGRRKRRRRRCTFTPCFQGRPWRLASNAPCLASSGMHGCPAADKLMDVHRRELLHLSAGMEERRSWTERCLLKFSKGGKGKVHEMILACSTLAALRRPMAHALRSTWTATECV
jgi:hypothetical protein